MPIACLLLLICFALFATGAEVPPPSTAIPDLTRALELENKGDIKGAERLLLEVIRRSEESGQQGDLGISLNNLAVLYAAIERPADAERYFMRSIRVLETVNLPMASHALARTRLHLASFYIETGRTRDAAKLNVPALFNELQSPEDQVRAQAMLGSMALAQNDLAKAEHLFLRVIAYWQANSTRSKAYMEIATSLNNLGIVAWRRGQHELAISRITQSLDAWKTGLGPDNVLLAKTMGNLAVISIDAKKYDQAVAWQEQATGIAQRVFGDVHPFTIGMQTFYAQTLKKAGRKEEANQVARAAAESRRIVRSRSVADYTLDYRDIAGRSK